MVDHKLEAVILSSEVYLVCMAHAFSTEVEEVMGLLIGWSNREKGVCYVSHCVQLKRLDKRKDRVEISEEQLVNTFSIVERLNKERGDRRSKNKDSKDLEETERLAGEPQSNNSLSAALKDSSEKEELRVVGWYHSHPHITVFPSEVDIRTQNQYQESLDNLWVGLIFGVFHSDSNKLGRCPYIAFQADTGMEISDDLPDLWDRSPTSLAIANSTSGIGGLKHRLIPVYVLPQMENSRKLGSSAIFGLTELSRLVLEESKEAFERRTKDGTTSPITSFHNAAVYDQAVCKVIGRLTAPLIRAFNARKGLIEKQQQRDQDQK